MSIIQNSTPWYPSSFVNMGNLSIALDTLMRSSIFQETPMERMDARHYGRPPADFPIDRLNTLLTDALAPQSIFPTEMQDITLMNGLVSWLYRNTDGVTRNALLMMSWYLRDPLIRYVPDGKFTIPMENKVEMERVYHSFSGESVNYMTNVIRHAVVTVPMEARLPMNQCKHVYAQLSALSAFDKQITSDTQLIDESQKCLRAVNPSMNLTPTMDTEQQTREYAIKRLFQTVQVISMISSGDNYSNLKALLANAQSLAMFARIRGAVEELCLTDTMTVLAAVERSVTAHSHTAQNLIARAEAGQLVYAEMSKLVREWHFLVNHDLDTVFSLIANMVKIICEILEQDDDALMITTIDDMITRTEIKSTYLKRRSRLPGR